MRRFQETTFQNELPSERIDADKGIIHGVKILGPTSSNGRTYSTEAMEEGRPLYEGCHVNVDHRQEGMLEEAPRSCMDQVGVMKNVVVESEGLYGDLHVIKSHPFAPILFERALRFPESFGLSHDASGDVEESDDGELVVNKIVEVYSVDVVSRPATNAGLFEHDKRKVSEMSIKKTKEQDGDPDVKPTPDEPETPTPEEDVIPPDPAPTIETPPVETPPSAPALSAQMLDQYCAAVDKVVRNGASAKDQLAEIKPILMKLEKALGIVSELETDAPAPSEGGAMESLLKKIDARLDRLEEMAEDPFGYGTRPRLDVAPKRVDTEKTLSEKVREAKVR